MNQDYIPDPERDDRALHAPTGLIAGAVYMGPAQPSGSGMTFPVDSVQRQSWWKRVGWMDPTIWGEPEEQQ